MRRGRCSWRSELFGEQAAGLEPEFLATLAEAKSNVASAGDGARIYKEKIGTMELGLEQVAAHYAISSVFSSFAEETELFCYRVRRISYDIYSSGRGRLALGRAQIASAITGQEQSFSFAVLHFGDQNITAAVKAYDGKRCGGSSRRLLQQAAEQVRGADFPDVIRLIDRYYGHVDYSLTSLFTRRAAAHRAVDSQFDACGYRELPDAPFTRITRACCTSFRRRVCPSHRH